MRSTYRKNIEKTQSELHRLQKTINQNSIWRLLIIVIAGFLLFKSFSTENILLVLAIILASMVVFLYLVKRQSILSKKKETQQDFLSVNQNEYTLLDNKFDNMYDHGVEFEDPKHPYTSDLDVFGERSLFSFLNRCATRDGRKVLASWLLTPADKKTIESRQEASGELATEVEWCLRFQSALLPAKKESRNMLEFLHSYFAFGREAMFSQFKRKYSNLAPWLMTLMLAISFFYTPALFLLLLLAVLHLGIAFASAGKVGQFSAHIDKMNRTLVAYSQGLKDMEDKDFGALLLQELKGRLNMKGGEVKISTSLERLSVLITRLDARNNLIVGTVLNMIFLWDIRCVSAINKWILESEEGVFEAIQVISETEALISLAALERNHPHWTKPLLSENYDIQALEVTNVHHPLLNAAVSIGNDFSMEGFDLGLITGSNMAGKSTFLRTVGINAVLAYTGAVVHAEAFEIPIFKLVTYMRIKDSLQESTSTFKAELDRMKYILEKVEAEDNAFFLIDEMFRGTNSVDKYLGSEAVILKLLKLKGKGLVATHDLQLSKLEEETRHKVKNFHFDIQVENNDMHFDYKLKEGKCTVFNASMLLESIGIQVDKTKGSY